jgi:hypothetical protein
VTYHRVRRGWHEWARWGGLPSRVDGERDGWCGMPSRMGWMDGMDGRVGCHRGWDGGMGWARWGGLPRVRMGSRTRDGWCRWWCRQWGELPLSPLSPSRLERVARAGPGETPLQGSGWHLALAPGTLRGGRVAARVRVRVGPNRTSPLSGRGGEVTPGQVSEPGDGRSRALGGHRGKSPGGHRAFQGAFGTLSKGEGIEKAADCCVQ